MQMLYFLLREFHGLPAWTRYVFIAITFVTMLGFGAMISPTVGLIVGGGVLLVAVLIAGFRWLLQRRRDRAAASFSADMRDNNAATPGALNDPARRARIEDLRRNFEAGLERYRAAGKDLYKLPWYVIVGEPGAGKTEAIRHSNVGFPPGMQDEFQGVGGTINMNWWFTDEAVILDTAGRLLFEEVPPGSTSEWQEFLGLLHKYRPDCPVNGLFLAIPSESLIKDTPEQIKRKAGRIAQQLEGIQKILDIRFPVYVVVTKCDLLNGFRDFFDELHDQTAQGQLLGWSNPDPLDAPFRVELVDEHIYTVVERLRRRRFGLLLDPVPRQGERRTDEVDRLYALPHSINLAAPNLRQYLQAIFNIGEWTAKPLFLRGIYFTSSMREGSALDQELATALSIDVEQLPDGRAWERERSYFLHDVFTKKSFRERGLVTRATNTKSLLLKRRLALLGTGFAALLALLAFSIYGYRSLRDSVGRQSGYWARASEDWSGNAWIPIAATDAIGAGKYQGKVPVGPGDRKATRMLFTEGQMPLEQFHARLRDMSELPVRVGWVFRPFAGFRNEIDSDRKKAQRVVFENSVIQPLLAAAREKMAKTTPDAKLSPDEQRLHGDALLALIRVESGIVKRRERKAAPTINAANFLPPLTRYVTGQEPDAELVRVMDWVYSEEGAAPRGWSPDWTSGGFSLGENAAIDHGLARFLADAGRSLQTGSDAFPVLTTLVAETKRFAKEEDVLFAASKGLGSVEQTDMLVSSQFNSLQEARGALDVTLDQAQKLGLFDGGTVSLVAAYEKLLREGRAKFVTAKSIETEADDLLQASETGETSVLHEKAAALKKAVADVVGSDARTYPLFAEIAERLRGVIAQMEQKFQGTFSDAEIAELRQLDDLHLADSGSGAPPYKSRWAVYDSSIKASPPINYAQTLELVGSGFQPLAEIFTRIAGIRKDVQNYRGTLSEKVIAICNYCFQRAELLHSDEFAKVYHTQARTKLGALVRFPILWPPSTGAADMKPEEVVAAAGMLDKVREDLRTPMFQNLKSPNKQALVDFAGKLAPLTPICDALVTSEHALRLSRVVLLGRKEQFELSGQQTGIDAYRAMQLRAGTTAHGALVKFGTPGRVPTGGDGETDLGRFTLYEPFHFHFHRTTEDQRVAVDMPAPPEWTALQLLEERHAVRIADGTRWRIALPPEANKLIWIELRFEKPLPELDAWPTRQSVGLGATRAR